MARSKSFLEVQKQIEVLRKEAERLRKLEANDVLVRIRQAIEAYGFTPADCGFTVPTNYGAARVRRREGFVAKYADGQGNEWGGRGPRPHWFKAALQAGKTAEQLLVVRARPRAASANGQRYA